MALCIFDVFRAQMGDDFLDFLSENNLKVVYVPACCTDRLQPLDVSVQKAVKNHLQFVNKIVVCVLVSINLPTYLW